MQNIIVPFLKKNFYFNQEDSLEKISKIIKDVLFKIRVFN